MLLYGTSLELKKNKRSRIHHLLTCQYYIFYFWKRELSFKNCHCTFFEEISYGYKLFIQEGCDQGLRLSMMASKVKKCAFNQTFITACPCI